jgi:MFS family permease
MGKTKMGRTILGMLVGLVTMWLTVTALEFLGHAMFPPPAGLDPQNPEQLQMIFATAPVGAFVMLVVAWAGGSFVGGWVAARIARHTRAAAIAVALFVMAGVAGMMVIVPDHPGWVSALGLVLPIPVGLVAARLAGMREKTLPK